MPGIAVTTFRRIAQVVKFGERQPRFPGGRRTALPKGIREDRWFVTTGPMTTATKTGSSLASYKMVPGQAQARACFWDTANKWYTPDVSANAKDQPIYNCTVLPAPIAAGKFFKCTIVSGVWQADLSTEC